MPQEIPQRSLSDWVMIDMQAHHFAYAADNLRAASLRMNDAGFTKLVRDVESQLHDPNLHVILDENDKVIGLNFGNDHIYGTQNGQNSTVENPTQSHWTVDESQDGKGTTTQKHEFADPKKDFEVTTSQDGNGITTTKMTYADPAKKSITIESSVDDKGVSVEKYRYDDPSKNITITAFVDDKGIHHENTEYADKSTQEVTQDTTARKISIVKKSKDGRVESSENQTY
jgi:hypothetical protein